MRKDKAGFFALIFGALLFWTWKSEAPKEKIDVRVSEIPEVIGTSIQAKPIEMDTMVKIMAEPLRIPTLKVDQEIAYRDTVIPLTEPFPLSTLPKMTIEIRQVKIINMCGCSDPQFPGGARHMKAYIASNIVYPWDDLQSGIEGKVYLDFVVEADGSVSTVTIKRGVSPAIDTEAKRVIESMPKWEPAHDPKHGDLKTRIRIPISFTIG